MYMNNTEPVEIDEYRLELENRIRNLLWTVSGDYQLDMKPDVSLFLRSKAIALYDGIKQGALARYYDKDMLGLYLVKKIFYINFYIKKVYFCCYGFGFATLYSEV